MRCLASLKSKLAMHRVFPLRERYFITRENKVRLRYITSCFVFAAMAAGSLMVAPASSLALHGSEAFRLASINPAAGPEDESFDEFTQAAINLNSAVSGGIRKASQAIQKTSAPRYKEIEIKPGDTMAGLLQTAGLSGTEAYEAVKALGEYYDVRKIKSGQKIDVHFKPGLDGELQFAKMEMKVGPVQEVSVQRKAGDAFEAALDEKELFPRTYARKAKIETSLYGSAARAGVPPSIIAEMIRVYSWNVDFQRDIRSGDDIEVMYEAFETEDGDFARYGNVLYANLHVNGKDHPIYRFEMEDGRTDYFEPEGISIRKTLMKTPIDGARISSGFGMRKHPVLGYNKMHKGMDFAAPTGTPIYAAGDGVVEYAGRFSSYGNYIRIRHNSKLKTAYAHLHSIKSGVKVGTRVKQGEVIGRVGTTGRSTGPHLHYEVMVNNSQVNPRSIDLPTGEQLAGSQLKRFKSVVASLRQQYVTLSEGLKFADNSDEDDSREIH